MKRLFLIFFILQIFTQTIFAQAFKETWQEKIDQGKTLYANDEFDKASKLFHQASQLIPTDTTAFVYLLDCAFKLKDVDLFYKTIESLKFLELENARFQLMAAVLAREKEENNKKALDILLNAQKKYPENYDLKKEEAVLYYMSNQYDMAYEKLNELSVVKPYDENVYAMLLFILKDKRKSFKEALQFAIKSQSLFPDKLYFYEQEANIYLLVKDFQKAQIAYEKILKMNPEDPKAYYNLALTFFQQGDYETSAQICLKAIEIDPNYLDAIYNVGTFYYYDGLRYNTALSDMDAYQYEEQGGEFESIAIESFELAKPYFEKAIELNPEELDAYENLNTISVLLDNLYEIRALKEKELIPTTAPAEISRPDLVISNLNFEYPEKNKLKKGQTGFVNFNIENFGNGEAANLQAISITPVIIPGLKFDRMTTIGSLAAGASLSVKIPVTYAKNSTETQGIEKLEGAENKMRIVVKADNNIKTDLVEFKINIGNDPVFGDENIVESTTEEVDFFNPDPIARNYLLLIGINNYHQWPQLKNAVPDVKGIKEVLLDKYDFDMDYVFELYNNDGTQENIRNELIKIKREITPNDNLIIYYAGHGFYDIEFDEGSWIPVDAANGNETDYMANSRLVKYLSKIKCKHQFIMADACFSGSLFVQGNKISYESGNDNLASRWALTSGNMEEVADGAVGMNSPFAESLIEFLKNNKMSSVPVTELISYICFQVKNKTAESTAQTPIGKPLNVKGNEGGEFILYSK